MINYSKFVENSRKWLSQYIKDNHLQSIVIGVSGGIDSTISCKIATKLQNKNLCLLEYENKAQLTEKSVGLIDLSTYNADDNRFHLPLDGIREFVINTIKKSGDVIVEAWVETGFAEVDAEIKDRTFNTAICGPWIYGDEGRKYNIVPDTPKYLQETEFGDFIQFFELYLNTIYKNMEGDKDLIYNWVDLKEIESKDLRPTSIKEMIKNGKFISHIINK